MEILSTVPLIILPSSTTPRAEGPHVSTIIQYLARKKGLLSEDDTPIQDDPCAVLRVSAGLAWEEHLSTIYPEILYHPGEMTHDGISANPDGYSLLDGIEDEPVSCIEEFKFTWKSSRTKPIDPDGRLNDKFWMWMTQLKSYCYMWGKVHKEPEPVRYGRLWVYHVNGDYSYRPGSSPQFQQHLFRFTDQELQENWDMLRRNRECQ